MRHLADLVQQGVALFQSGTSKKQTALFLVVIDIGFDRRDVIGNNLRQSIFRTHNDKAKQQEHSCQSPSSVSVVLIRHINCIDHITDSL